MIEKPPLGIMPKKIWKTNRAYELIRAIERQLDAPHLCDWDLIRGWVAEIKELADTIDE